MTYRDPGAPLDARVEDLLAQMSVREKVAQLGAIFPFALLDEGGVNRTKLESTLAEGIGQLSMVTMLAPGGPEPMMETVTTIQRFLVEETRLGIPAICHAEALSGLLHPSATSFPTALALAATWEPDLVESMTEVIRQETRALGIQQALSPVLDVARDARWGRVHETYGEDPLLCSAMGAAFVRGLQGPDLAHGVVATGKHFLGYSLSEAGRNLAAVLLSERELFEVFARPFEAAIREAQLASIMNSYSEINGRPVAGDRRILTDLLREQLGFEGFVVADYGAISMLWNRQRTAADAHDAGVQSLEAGLDVELPETDSYGDAMVDAFERGDLDDEVLETSVRRVLHAKFRLGLFERPYPDPAAFAEVVARPQRHHLAAEIARRSTVLLENDGDLLPLEEAIGTIAVIGPLADSVRGLFSGYTPAASAELRMALRGTGAQQGDALAAAFEAEVVMSTVTATAPEEVEDAVRALYPDTRTVLEAVRARVGTSSEVLHAPGCTVNGDSADEIPAAVAAAAGADVAIVVLGDKTGWTFDCTSGEGRDRSSLDLPGVQEQLLAAVCATGTPVVVVLLNGRPAPLGGGNAPVSAVLEAWQPGAVGADHLAAMLFGDVSPSGKLPITVPRTGGQCPIHHAHHAGSSYARKAQGLQCYSDTDPTPAYPFGHGLVYTTFDYLALDVSAAEVSADGVVDVTVTLANTGRRAGEEVVQLYARTRLRGLTRPERELVGFRRVALDAGEAADVTFRIALAQLAFLGHELELAVHPGVVELWAGSSSDQLPLSGRFEILGPPRPLSHRTNFWPEVTVHRRGPHAGGKEG